MIPLLTILIFLLLYIGFTLEKISLLFVNISVACTLLLSIIVFLISYVQSLYHPIEKRIQRAVSEHQKHYPQIKVQYQILLNLSAHPLFEHNIKDAFNIRYQDCIIHGYISDHIFYLHISHPKNQLSSIAKLWSELEKCHTRFRSICLCIQPKQLRKISQKLHTDWLFIRHLLQSAKESTLLLNHPKLSKSMYYIQEYGHAIHPIRLNPHQSLIHVLHQANIQLNQLISSLFEQRNELCLYPPIDQNQKSHIFQMSQILTDLKPDILQLIAYLAEHRIKFYGICFGQYTPFSPDPNITQRYHLKSIAIALTLLSVAFFSTQRVFTLKVDHKLSLLPKEKLAEALYKLNTRSFKHIKKKHLHRLKSLYLEESPQKEAYSYLLGSFKYGTSDFKYHIINQLTDQDLPDPVVKFLAQNWFSTSKNKKPALSEIASIIAKEHIHPTCEMLDAKHLDTCIQSLGKIQNYQQYDKTLTTLEKTLLPLNFEEHAQTVRQLNYLAQNPKHIGQEALKKIENMLPILQQEKHSTLINKAKSLQSLIQLLQSSQGQYILQTIKHLHDIYHAADDEKTAFETVQKAYSSEKHPLSAIHFIKKNLSSYQATWLSNIVDPLIHSLRNKTHLFLKRNWNTSVYPLLEDISKHYPFSKDQPDISAQDLYPGFQAIEDYFNQYLRMFVYEEDGDLIVKPHTLNIQIPENILATYIYTKVFSSAMDIKSDHFHAAFAICIKDMPHPVEKIILHAGNKDIELQPQKASILHWDSRYPVGFDVTLQDGSHLSLIQNNSWSLLHLMSLFHTKRYYQYKSPDGSVSFSVEIKPQYPVDLLNNELIEGLPFYPWQ